MIYARYDTHIYIYTMMLISGRQCDDLKLVHIAK